jgi:NAD(P)-dependent dehydrogenase (short-subunit alcohol dehydrogenase family)
MQDLNGTAVITGGGSGIGLALARAFGAAGMSVVLGDIEPAALVDAVEDLTRDGVTAIGVEVDVRSPDDMVRLRDDALQATGSIDVVCLNAGVAPTGRVLDTTLDTWHWVIDVNLLGVVHGIAAFGPHLSAQGRGHLVLTSSAAGLINSPFLGAYAATKHAVVGLAAVLRDELAVDGVGVSVVCPGTIATDIFHSERNRPGGAGAATHSDPDVIEFYRGVVDSSLPPEVVADAVLGAVRDDRLFVLPSPELDEFIDARHAEIEAGIAAR